MRIALATCRVLPEPDPDESLVLDAFRRAEADVRTLPWDDPDAPFAEQDLVVLRSTWNYFEDIDGFVAFVDRVGRRTRLRNPPDVVRWNAVKTYLRDLEARGVPIVPTELVSAGTACDFARLVQDKGWDDVVVKPLVSAGSFRTERFAPRDGERAQAFVDALVRDRDTMIQRYMPEVETYGERSLVWIDGEITHAIRKSPRFSGGFEQVSDEVPILPEERAFAHDVIAASGARDLLYARIDMIRDESGVRRVMELELIEPSLFFAQCPRALERFVRAAIGHAQRR